MTTATDTAPDSASASLTAGLRASAMAANTADASEQHYGLATEFFRQMLGRHISC